MHIVYDHGWNYEGYRASLMTRTWKIFRCITSQKFHKSTWPDYTLETIPNEEITHRRISAGVFIPKQWKIQENKWSYLCLTNPCHFIPPHLMCFTTIGLVFKNMISKYKIHLQRFACVWFFFIWDCFIVDKTQACEFQHQAEQGRSRWTFSARCGAAAIWDFRFTDFSLAIC